ncbi:MAG: glycosyltransferase [Chloroflexota bacterium]|nr:glycosyltransferase [Chloroflexota bacterium]
MVGTIATGTDRTTAAPCIAGPVPRIAYVAYPSSLTLRSANAVQTYATVAALRSCAPDGAALIPRFAFRPSAFTALGATHLLRLPFNAGRHLIRSVFWSYLERTWFALRALVHIAVRRRRPAVVYVRDVICALWLSLILPRFLHIAVIFEMHDREATNPSANSGPVTRWIAPHIDTLAIRNASGLVSLTYAFIPELDAIIGTARHPLIEVIPDAYDDDVYRPRDRAQARLALDLPPDAPVIAYTGLTFAYHGVDLLVDAFAIVNETLPDALLVLVGGRDGERAAIAAQAARLGITDRVRIVSPRPVHAIPAYLAAADVLVIPDTVTKASASPLKLFEYAAMARPIVAMDLPALREILPSDAAHYVTPGDPATIAAGIVWLEAHPDDAAAMAACARHAVERYTYRHRATAIIAFCQRVCEPANA